MTAHARRESLGQEMTSVVSQEWLSGQPQAGAAGAFVLRDAGTHGVGAVTADEPPILISDHRPELDARHAMWAADGQGCVSRQWVLLHTSKGDWHAGFQTPRPVILMKNKGSWDSRIDIELKPAPRFRHACRQAGRSDNQTETTSLVSAGEKATATPDSMSHGTPVE
jgi:hypothetical protein